MKTNRSAFTIVELLIVIVVIAILAAISVVAYTGVQSRAQDSQRLNDMQNIVSALERYKIDNSRYPAVILSGMGAQAGWESSAREADGEFISPLKAYGFAGGTPVDPINNAVEATTTEARTNASYGYNYHRYAAGYGGCDPAKGAFYILGVMTTAATGTATHPKSPGFKCTRDWASDFSWVTGGFEG